MSDERDELIARWDTMAAGWKATRANFQRAMEPVSQWLVEAIHPQPGHSVLELAAGLGDTGLLAAQLVAPGGSVLITDGSDNMVAAAREHAEEVGATNVELRSMQAEWIDLPTASVDGVICRFGYMLLLDPEAALRETRRVLKPGGRVALAVWDDLERNPWMKVLREALMARGLAPAAVPDGPGPFSLGSEEAVAELLATAGFEDIEVSPMDLVMGAASLDAWWDHVMQTSITTAELVRGLAPAEHYQLRDLVDAGYSPYVRDDGTLEAARAGAGRGGSRVARPARAHLARRAFAFYWGTGIADDVPALTYYLVLSLAPVALGLAALEALLLSNTQSAINVADGLNRFLPDAAHADIRHLVLGTRDNSPVLLAIALATMLWTTSGAIGVIERCESRILECERHNIVTGRLRNMALGAGIAIMVLAASTGAPVIGDVADALNIRRTLPGTLLVVVNTIGSIIVFALLYHWAPRARPNWRACLLGAVPAGIAIQAVPSIVGLYFGAGAGFAAVRLFLLLAVIIAGLYIIALVTLVGAGIAVKYELRRRDRIRRPCTTTTTLTSPSSTARPLPSSASAPKVTPTP